MNNSQKTRPLIALAVILLLGGTAYGSVLLLGEPESDPVVTTIPLSGRWNLTMEAGNLAGPQCPSSLGTFTTTGPAYLQVSNDGFFATLSIESRYYPSNGMFVDDIYNYYSQLQNFPTFDGDGNQTTGSARVEFVAASSEFIRGQLIWDNREGCTGNYPITMVFEAPFDLPLYTAQSGIWDIDFDEPIECDDTIIIPSAFSGFPSGEVDVDVVVNLDSSTFSDIITLNPGLFEVELNQSEGTNVYTQDINLDDDFGIGGQEFPYVGPDGSLDYNQSVNASFEVLLTGDNQAQGTVFGTGPGGCTFSAGFTMTMNLPSV